MRLDRHTIARSLMTAGITAALGFTTLSATAAEDPVHPHAHPVAAVISTPAATARQKAYDHTQALMALQKQWANAKEAAKSRALEQLVAKAEERRAYLLDLMESNPAEVLRVAIPEDKQMGMPAEVLEKLEKPLELEGELTATYTDYLDGTHKKHQYLTTPFSERFELHVAGKGLHLQSGSDLRVNGIMFNNDSEENGVTASLAIDGNNVETLGCCTDSSSSSTVTPELPYALGEQKTLVILVAFQDKPDDRPPQYTTVADWNNLVFGEVSDYFRENSDGQTWLNGDTLGWFTIPKQSTSCDQWGIAYDAQAAAENAGADLSAYNRFVIVFPWNSACGWGGQGSVGGENTYAWINGQPGLQTTAHEMGHNLGLGHSEFLDCDVSPLGNTCSRMQYGDYLDVMGGSPSGHFNGFQKERLGWLPAGGVQEIESSGNYAIDSYVGTGSGMPKVLKVLKSVDAQTGAKSWYYLESRQASGFDSFIANSNYAIPENVLNGVVIHQATEGVYNSSRLLDMTPASSRYDDMKDPALVSGYSFNDSDAGISITTDWVNADQAQVIVNVGPQPCITNAPTIEVAPGQSDWVAAGSTQTYILSITSNDSAACSATPVGLSASVPSGWSNALSNSSVTLAPGETSVETLNVTSSETAADGFYDITVTASSSAGNSQATVNYVISNPALNSAPSAENDTATTDSGVAVSIPVLANDLDSDGDSLSINIFSQGRNGAVSRGNAGTLIYTPNNTFSGSDSFTYEVSDGKGGTDSAVVTVTVNTVIEANTAPAAKDDAAEVEKGATVIINVLGNDIDADGDQLAVLSFSQGAKGSVSRNADGTLTYTAAKSFKSNDSFTYTITDGDLTSSASVTLTLTQSSTIDSGNGNGGSKGGGKPQ